jgi:hypothetical protein
MSNYLYITGILFTHLMLNGCAYTTDLANKPQFRELAAGPSQTKRQLRLYDINFQSGAGSNRYNLTTVDQGGDALIAFIPAGHPIKLNHVYVHHDIGGAWGQAVGEIMVNGRTYPFGFYMGSSLSEAPDRLFKAFEVR